MLHVATHPPTSYFDKPSYHHHRRPSHTAPTSSPAVQLPRTLSRPTFVDISRESIPPELANVPAEYIRRGLRPRANEMLAALSSIQLPSTVPKSRLPSSIPIRSAPPSSHPTHVLAISASKSSSDQTALFPIHSLVLASHCAHIPTVPRPQSALQLPVLHLSLPSPAAFSILHSFMYTHRLDHVLKALFPFPSSFLHQHITHESIRATLSSGTTLHQLSTYLASSASESLHTLTTHAAHVKELWQDMAALGLYDPELWDTLDLAWEVVLGAMNLAASK